MTAPTEIRPKMPACDREASPSTLRPRSGHVSALMKIRAHGDMLIPDIGHYFYSGP